MGEGVKRKGKKEQKKRRRKERGEKKPNDLSKKQDEKKKAHLPQRHVLHRRLPSGRVEGKHEVAVAVFSPPPLSGGPGPAGEPRGQAPEQRARGEPVDDDIPAASRGERDPARRVRRGEERGRREAL